VNQFRIIDTETTGPSSTPPDVACEVAAVDLDWHPESKVGQLLAPKSGLVQIGIKMPPDARGVHHIGDEELERHGKDISAVFKSVIAPFPYPEKIIFVAHNAEYEFGTVRDASGKLLKDYIPDTVPIICTYKSALRLWPDAPNHKLQTLRYLLDLKIPDKLDGGLPHRALPDAVVNAVLLIACLKLASAEQMVQWTKEPRLLPTCPIGKKQGWAGQKWADVDPDKPGEKGGGFLRWMLEQPDMEADLKWNARQELDRREQSFHTEGRDKYMALVPGVIAMAKTLFDLREWFKLEMPTRETLAIREGTAEYATIVALCKAQADKLPKAVAPALPAPAATPAPAQPAPAASADEPPLPEPGEYLEAPPDDDDSDRQAA
jgi:exodeoxyribonuclease X